MNSRLLFLITLIISFCSTFINAQWQKQTNGLPNTWNLGWAIDASDSNNILITTSSGLFGTTDGGGNWSKIEFPDTIIETAIDVSIINESHYWAATDLGKIIATTDAGKNWTVQFNDESKTQFMNYIEMFDEMKGVAMGDAPFPLQKKTAVFLKTTDGGNTWIQSSDTTLIDVYSGDTWRRLDFVNPKLGYFYESGITPQKLLKTTNGCENWQNTYYPGAATVLKCYNENIVLAHSILPAGISRTTNGGNSWEESAFRGGWGNDFEFIPGDASKVFFTDHDKLFFSSDTGKTWQEVFVDTIELMGRDIVFPDQNHGWILGDSGRVYKTNTGGVITHTIDTNQTVDYISANEIFMWIGNNGMGSHDPRSDGSGFYWPGGKGATIPAIFADGLVWGGKVNGEIRVNGSTYRYGLTPGYILPSGLPSDPLEIKSKIFKLKKDWQYLPPGAERNRYEFDFLNWPVDVGAPWEDNNGDGVYTLGIDNPKILGDETLFFVANDLDTLTSLYAYGSNPIGLEFQVTTFGFNSELLKDVVFKKYKMINKSPNTITDMYLSYWADDDLGYPNDDYVGFDSSYYIGYVYNGDNDDNGFYGTPPPAVGHMIVQGPIIPTQVGDSARYDNGWRNGFSNLKMSSSGMIVKTSVIWPNDPDLGDYDGTIQFYNMMQGLQMDGSPIINPYTGEATVWPLSGDPVSGVGWYRLPDYPTGWDQRYHVPTGPFTLAPADTQEIVFAIFMARGNSNLNSVTKLKEYAQLIQDWYNNDFVVDVEDIAQIPPLEFSLSQNYPNPFNPNTKISWQTPVSSFITLKVYDVLGNEVATLVDEYKPAGKYEVELNPSSSIKNLSSGIYFYRIQAGSFAQTKKMMVLK